MANFLPSCNANHQGKSYISGLAENFSIVPRMAKEKNELHVAVSKRILMCMQDARIPTRQALADALGVEMTRVKNWANGASTPTLAELIRLCDYFAVTTDWMLTGATSGLTEGKRIRLHAIQSGMVIPEWTPERPTANQPEIARPQLKLSVWSKQPMGPAKQTCK